MALSRPEELLQRIKAEFPDITWETYAFFDHGWDHEVIILDGRWVFRFPLESEYAEALKDEIALLAFLGKRLSVPIPQYTRIAQDLSFGGYEAVPGTELKEPRLQTFTEENRQRAVTQIARFLTSLHTIPIEEVRPFHVDSYNYLDDFDELRNGADTHLSGYLSAEDYAQVQKIISKVAALPREGLPAVLIHNDISAEHILWDERTGQIGVIDFSDRVIGDPALDFGGLFVYGEAFVRAVYDTYEGPKDEQFLDRAKLYYQRFGIFMMIDSFDADLKMTFDKAKAIFDKAKEL